MCFRDNIFNQRDVNVSGAPAVSFVCDTAVLDKLNKRFNDISTGDYKKSGLIVHKIDDPDFPIDCKTSPCPSIWNVGQLSPEGYRKMFPYFASSYIRSDITQAASKSTGFTRWILYDAGVTPYGLIIDPSAAPDVWKDDNIKCMYPADAASGKPKQGSCGQKKCSYRQNEQHDYDFCGNYPKSIPSAGGNHALNDVDYTQYFKQSKTTGVSYNCPLYPDDPLCQMPSLKNNSADWASLIKYSKIFAALPCCADPGKKGTNCNPICWPAYNKLLSTRYRGDKFNEIEVVPLNNWGKLLNSSGFMHLFFVCDSSLTSNISDDWTLYTCTKGSFKLMSTTFGRFLSQVKSPLPDSMKSSPDGNYNAVMFDLSAAKSGKGPFICPSS